MIRLTMACFVLYPGLALADPLPDALDDTIPDRSADSAFAEMPGITDVQQWCSSDLECPPCATCQGSYCTEAKYAGCINGGGCPGGQICLPAAATPCTWACVQPECTSDADCGACQVCQAGNGKCAAATVACKVDADCGKYHLCQVDAQLPCNNKCVLDQDVLPPGPDAADASSPDVPGKPDVPAEPDTVAADVVLVFGDTSEKDAAAKPDAAAETVPEPQPDGAQATETSAAKPVPKPVPKADGCQAGRTSAQWSWLWLALALGAAGPRRPKTSRRVHTP